MAMPAKETLLSWKEARPLAPSPSAAPLHCAVSLSSLLVVFSVQMEREVLVV